MSDSAPDGALIDKARKRFERMLLRNIKGLEYFSSPAPPVGCTPGEIVIDRGTLRLVHYRPLTDEVYRLPVLIVMSITNRGYIFDMQPGQSFVEYLLSAGYDVFMVDWQPPRLDERSVGIDNYVLDFLPACTAKIAEITGESDVSVIGYCLGGVLTLIWAALHPEGPARNLLIFTTPVNMSEMGMFHTWSDKRFFDVDRLLEAYGNCPPEVVYAAFDLMRPAEKAAGNIRLWDNMWNDEFVKSHRMFDRWATDILPLPGRFFSENVKQLMWENALAEGTLEVAGRKVNLANITVPLFVATAEHDSVVPPKSSIPLIELAGSQDKHHVHLRGGHVSVIAGPNAVKRLWPQVDIWLRERSI
jgi:polyhydroxyalkanoate synthase